MNLDQYRTYAVQVGDPGLTREVPATCADVGCDAFLHGWRTVLDLSTDLGQRQWAHIRDHAGRAFNDVSEQYGVDPPLLVLWFDPGQRCFRPHTMRPRLFVAYRGQLGHRVSPVVRMSAEQWVDHFAQNQQTLADLQRKG